MIETTQNTKNIEDIKKDATDLYWLAFLLTEHQDLRIDIAADTAVSRDYAIPFFAEWMRGWQRRLVIGRALTAIHDELANSARRTQLARANGSAAPQRNWSLSPDTTKSDLQQALLSIDLFPRAASPLLVVEGMRMADAAIPLGCRSPADPTAIREAQAIGLRELTANLACKNSLEDQRGNRAITEAPNEALFLATNHGCLPLA